MLLPRPSDTPVLSAQMRTDQQWQAIRQLHLRDGIALAPAVQVREVSVNPRRTVRYRPASTIDDDVRRRAYEAIALSIDNG